MELNQTGTFFLTLQQQSIASACISLPTEVKIYFATELDKDHQTQYVRMGLKIIHCMDTQIVQLHIE